MQLSNERRKIQRYDVRVPCLIICNGIQAKATLVDICAEGLGFVTSMPFLYAGRSVQIIFEKGHLYSDNDNSLYLCIEIRNQVNDTFGKRFGAKLREIPKEYPQYLKTLLRKNRCNLVCNALL